MPNSKAHPLFIAKTVGLLSVALFVVFFCKISNVHAAINAPIAPTSTDFVDVTSIRYNWSWGGGQETRYIVEQSINGINFTVASTTLPTTTLNYTFTGLATNTQYWFRVAAATSSSPTSTYTTSSPVYTKAAPPNLSFITFSTSSLSLTFLADTNPPSTTYSFQIRDVGNNFLHFLDQNGAPTSTAVYQTTSTWGATIIATGLSINTPYILVALSRNGNNLTSVFSSNQTPYTFANPAGTPIIGTPTVSTLPITIAVNGNPSSTQFAIFNTTTANYLNASGAATSSPVWQTTSTWGANFAATGLTENAAYQFVVIARNGDSINAATSSPSVATFTSTVPVSSGSSGGAIPVNSASQGGVLVNPTPSVSPAPIAVPPVSIPGPINPVVFPKTIFTRALAVGSKGAEVTALQQKLRELGFFKFPTNTGYYGAVTRAAVIAFQKKYNLKPYPGIVGPLTRAKLNSL